MKCAGTKSQAEDPPGPVQDIAEAAGADADQPGLSFLQHQVNRRIREALVQIRLRVAKIPVDHPVLVDISPDANVGWSPQRLPEPPGSGSGVEITPRLGHVRTILGAFLQWTADDLADARGMTRATASIETKDYRDELVPGWVGCARNGGTDDVHGDLEGEAAWEGLSVVDEAGIGGFVGLSRFEVTLAGLAGSFVLQVSGTVAADGTSEASVQVLSGSGAGELAGLRGSGGITSGPDGSALVLDYVRD